MQTKRFVNLNKATTYVPGPNGQSVGVRPFTETLNDHTRRPDGIYVLEGDFWSRYAQGGKAGPLHPFPAPQAFGRASLPSVQVHHCDGRSDDGRTRTDDGEVGAVAVQSVPGTFRAAGDVITPGGKIRRRNPETGLDEEVEDTPANRNVLKPLNPPGVQEPTAQLKRSIIDYMEEMKIETVEQFNALTDEQLLSIPGMSALALPRLRENIRTFLTALAAKKAASASPATDEDTDDEEESDDDEAVDEDDEDEDDDEEDEPAPVAARNPQRAKTRPIPLGAKPADTVSKKPAPTKPKPGVRKGGRDTTAKKKR